MIWIAALSLSIALPVRAEPAPNLVERLLDPYQADSARKELRGLPESAQKMLLPGLTKELKDGEDDRRRSALAAIDAMRPAAREAAVPALVAAIREARSFTDPESGAPSFWPFQDALSRLGSPAVTALAAQLDALSAGKRLSDADASLAARLCETLGTMGAKAEAAIPALGRLLRKLLDPRFVTFGPVGRMPPGYKYYGQASMAEVLKHADSGAEAAGAVMHALGANGPAAQPAAPLLAEVLVQTRHPAALSALSFLGASANEARPALESALTAKLTALRSYAAIALLHIEPTHKRAAQLLLSELSKLLRDEGDEVRLRALGALGQMGPAARDAIPILVQALREGWSFDAGWEDGVDHSPFQETLARLGPRAARELAARLDSVTAGGKISPEDAPFASLAAGTLSRMGPAGRESIPALIRTARAGEGIRVYPSYEPGRDAVAALGSIGAADAESISLVMEALLGREDRHTAFIALCRLGPAAKLAVPRLTAALGDADLDLRARAALVLLKIEAGNQEALNILLAMLRSFDKSEWVRMSPDELREMRRTRRRAGWTAPSVMTALSGFKEARIDFKEFADLIPPIVEMLEFKYPLGERQRMHRTALEALHLLEGIDHPDAHAAVERFHKANPWLREGRNR